MNRVPGPACQSSPGGVDGRAVEARLGTTSPSRTTARRALRRARILEQTLATTSAGHGANLRLIAQGAGVAVGTLYRHFPSKEHLLVAALGRWLEDLEQRIGPDLCSIGDPYRRLRYLVEELCEAFSRAPQLANAMMRAYVVADAAVAVEVETVRSQFVDLFADALDQNSPTESYFDVGELLTDVLASNLLALTQGRAQMSDVHRRLLQMVELLANRRDTVV